MTYEVSHAPHLKYKYNIQKIMIYVIISLLPTTIAGIYFFGFRALMIILLSVVSAVLTEYVIQKLSNKPIRINDFSAVVTGLLLALVIPPTIPYWLPVVGSIFAIAIVKEAFGGLGQNIFNPALASRAFLMASWPTLMTTWVAARSVDAISTATPLGIMKLHGEQAAIQSASYWSLFIGNHAGSIGETSTIALLIGAAFLFFMKLIDWKIPLPYIGTVFILSLIFGKDPLWQIMAGGLIIGAFFMATDYVTSPITKTGRIIFGVGCGIFTVIIRFWGGYPEGVCYAILIMNMCVPLIDRYTIPKVTGVIKKKKVQENKKEDKK
jgi:Na+-translocating ferredoxin:NAD+ oxidoreductase subunit D